AAAARKRAHRCTAAQMRNDHAPGHNLWRHLRQPAGNVLVREAVEPVPAHALRVQALRDRVMVRKRVVATMEGGVEAGDLRKIGRTGKDRTDRGQGIRLAQGRGRNIPLQLREHPPVPHYPPPALPPPPPHPHPPPPPPPPPPSPPPP